MDTSRASVAACALRSGDASRYPSMYLNRSEPSSRKRSFTLDSTDQDSWCVFRSMNTRGVSS